MIYVLTIYNDKNEFQGFVCVPRRSAKVRSFRTQQLAKAQRLPTRDEANRKAMRFNSMNEHKGECVHVVPFNPENK